ncbi:DegT/DnrJ/EryC1/StrS family aminotransferase [Saccharopolyspora montiporae]|uniref:DegT/DnrJ/EryC1/StrS family aminotransferase n=1 Tax=Saccharopolyspora montiporae TaxID=2781240 RepID=UPI00351C8037
MGNDAEAAGAGGVSRTADPVAESDRVPFFSQARTFERLWPVISAKVGEVFDNGKFSHGRQVAELEQRLAEYTGARHVIGVNSGTDALVLLLRALGIEPGDEVVVPAYSFVSTATSVVLAGGTPVFADIDPDRYALDPDELARVSGPRTRFAMPAHLFSAMADMSALAQQANRLGITLLEDSAEAIGMRQCGVHAGLHGAGGVLSFFPSKTLGAIGDAGAVLTDDPAVADLVAGLRHHGRFGRTLDHFPGISTETAACGTNSKMDDVQAAVLLAKLTALDADIRRRAELAAQYRDRLAEAPGILRLPEPPAADDAGGRVFYVYLIEVEYRDELVAHLHQCGIGTETYYPVPLHRQPCFADGGHARGSFPHAEAAAEHAVALPLYPDLDESDVDRVCDAVWDFRLGRLSA